MKRWQIVAGVMGFVLASGAMRAQDDVFSIKDGKSKLQLCSGLPCVEVMVDKRKLMLAVDTGNPHSVVDADLTTMEGLDTTPYVSQSGKTVPGWSTSSIPSVKIGTIELKNLPVAVGHLGDARSANQMPDVDGTLGYDAFKGKMVRMDLKKMTIEVSGADGGCSATAIKLIPFGKAGPPIVTATGFSVNGKPVQAQVDTMYAGTMLIFPTAVDAVGLTTESKAKAQEHFPYTDGGVDMKKSTAKEAFAGKELGDQPVYFAMPGVHLPDGLFEATVGMGLMNGKTVTFDFGHSCFGMM